MPFTSIAQGACSLSEPQPKFSLVIITFFPATSVFGLKPSIFKSQKDKVLIPVLELNQDILLE